jgi:hypothetical protein
MEGSEWTKALDSVQGTLDAVRKSPWYSSQELLQEAAIELAQMDDKGILELSDSKTALRRFLEKLRYRTNGAGAERKRRQRGIHVVVLTELTEPQRDALESIALALDIAEAVSKVRDIDRQIAKRLMEGATWAEIRSSSCLTKRKIKGIQDRLRRALTNVDRDYCGDCNDGYAAKQRSNE